MPARRPMVEGAPVWIDLMSRDLDASIAFYSGLFGWEHSGYGPEMGNYGEFRRDGESVAGIGPLDDGEPGSTAWTVYLSTPDVDAAAARAKEHGGTVLMEPDDVPGQGRFLVTADPLGTPVGFWQPGGYDGIATLGEPGTPAWFELWTTDHDRVVGFLRDVARWEPARMPGDMEYSTHLKEDEAEAGVFGAGHELAQDDPLWMVYLGVADLDAAVARVPELGGTVLGEPADSPYGRIVGAADPNGARFQLIEV